VRKFDRVTTCAGKQKKIQFEFNLQEDDAGDVAGDLVDELVECHAKALPSESQEKRDQRVYDMKQEFQECIVEAGVYRVTCPVLCVCVCRPCSCVCALLRWRGAAAVIAVPCVEGGVWRACMVSSLAISSYLRPAELRRTESCSRDVSEKSGPERRTSSSSSTSSSSDKRGRANKRGRATQRC